MTEIVQIPTRHNRDYLKLMMDIALVKINAGGKINQFLDKAAGNYTDCLKTGDRLKKRRAR